MSQSNCSFCFHPESLCSCGLSSLRAKDTTQNQSVKIVLFSILIIAALLHLVNWNQYFVQIIPLKMKELTGMATSRDLIQISLICKDRKKMSCEVTAIENAFRKDPSTRDYLARAGELYSSKKQYASAAKVLTSYFKAGGKDRDARHLYANALAETGQFKEAKKQYAYLVKTDSKEPDFQLAREYVAILMKNNDYKIAKETIEKYRGRARTAMLFMDSELKSAQARIGQ